jgi:hypothetical protein
MTLSRDVVAGACAGSCVVLITTPLDVIKVLCFNQTYLLPYLTLNIPTDTGSNASARSLPPSSLSPHCQALCRFPACTMGWQL